MEEILGDGVWVMLLPITKPMNLNHRTHWAVKAKMTRELRDAACDIAKSMKIPHCERVRIQLVYRPRDARRRDSLNLIPTHKAAEDGLVDAGVIDDDTPFYVEPAMPMILEKMEGQKRGVVQLVVTKLA